MALFRLAETLRVADPETLTRKLPPALIADWFKYLDAKEKQYDKIEYYLVQLSALVAALVGGVEPGTLVWDRGKSTKRNKKINAAETEKLLRAAFGV